MYKKIDKDILEKISIQQTNKKVNVIVKLKNYNKCKNYILKNFELQNFMEFPFISSCAFTVDSADVVRLSRHNYVVYISGNNSVTSLVYKSKKFLKYDEFVKDKIFEDKHSCVVIDTGVYPHIDFCLGKNRIVEFVDLINNNKNMYDDNGHGTFVVGVLAGGGIADKYAGIDNKCQVVVIKALDKQGETTTGKILEAMQWVVKNKDKYKIKIVCMSFGSLLRDNDPLVKGVEVLWNNGIVVVAACGNGGPESETIMSPGASKKIITVGALNTTKLNDIKVADFSSRGPVQNYFKPDIMVPGVDIISTNVFDKENKFYTIMSGTSMAAPMVAGVASLLIGINGNYTPDQIKYMLIKSCDAITGDRNIEGFGKLDLSKINLL